jgi:hypothetical protein
MFGCADTFGVYCIASLDQDLRHFLVQDIILDVMCPAPDVRRVWCIRYMRPLMIHDMVKIQPIWHIGVKDWLSPLTLTMSVPTPAASGRLCRSLLIESICNATWTQVAEKRAPTEIWR